MTIIWETYLFEWIKIEITLIQSNKLSWFLSHYKIICCRSSVQAVIIIIIIILYQYLRLVLKLNYFVTVFNSLYEHLIIVFSGSIHQSESFSILSVTYPKLTKCTYRLFYDVFLHHRVVVLIVVELVLNLWIFKNKNK